MMSFERTSTEARGSTGERIPRDGVRLSEAVDESNHAQKARPNRHLLVERLRQSIAAGDYLTPVKIDGTVERLCRELFGR
jgi:anti-sigma28 factor (negative regulator of flagellin synthesis)